MLRQVSLPKGVSTVRVSAPRGRRTATVPRAESAAWQATYKYLKAQNVVSVEPEEAAALVASGDWIMVDVRPPELYEAAHPEGSESAPLWISLDISKAGMQNLIRGFAAAVNGVKPVMPSPTFDEDVKRIAASGKGLIFFDETGGTLRPSVNFPIGKNSRSLNAVAKVLGTGILKTDKVRHMERGVFGWNKAGLPFEGEYDASNAGRSPNVAEEPKIDPQNSPRDPPQYLQRANKE